MHKINELILSLVKIIYVHSKYDFYTHQFSAGLNNTVTHVLLVLEGILWDSQYI